MWYFRGISQKSYDVKNAARASTSIVSTTPTSSSVLDVWGYTPDEFPTTRSSDEWRGRPLSRYSEWDMYIKHDKNFKSIQVQETFYKTSAGQQKIRREFSGFINVFWTFMLSEISLSTYKVYSTTRIQEINKNFLNTVFRRFVI